MKSLVAVCVLALAFVVFGAVAANAADLPQSGQVSDQMLSAMGLGGMQRLSDAQGEQIRGKCFFFHPGFRPGFRPGILAVNFAYIRIGELERGHVSVSQRITIGR